MFVPGAKRRGAFPVERVQREYRVEWLVSVIGLVLV